MRLYANLAGGERKKKKKNDQKIKTPLTLCEESFVSALYGFGAVRQTGDIFERGEAVWGGWREGRHFKPPLAAAGSVSAPLGKHRLQARRTMSHRAHTTRRLRFQLLYRVALKAASITAE